MNISTEQVSEGGFHLYRMGAWSLLPRFLKFQIVSEVVLTNFKKIYLFNKWDRMKTIMLGAS